MDGVENLETIYICRPDGAIAKVSVPSGDDDLWHCIWYHFPQAYEVLGDDAILPCDSDYEWSEKFSEEDDYDLATWYAKGMETVLAPLEDNEDCKVGISASRREGIAEVVWRAKDGTRYHQTILLNQGDFEAIALGADPIEDRWEDGNGNLVCYDNAEEFR